MREWEKGMPIGIANVLNRTAGKDTRVAFKALEKAELDTITSLSEIRAIARRYSKRFKVPIVVDAEFIDREHPGADGVHAYRKGKSKIYLHPILKYYTRPYIEGVIEHEIDHMKVEQKWEDIL